MKPGVVPKIIACAIIISVYGTNMLISQQRFTLLSIVLNGFLCMMGLLFVVSSD